MVGKSKNGRKTAERFQNLPQLLRLLIKVKQKCSASQKRDGNFHVFANNRWAIPSPLILDDSGFLGIYQRLSYNLLAVPSSCPTAFKNISQQLSAKTRQFPSFFS
jgi:hypothetical protein